MVNYPVGDFLIRIKNASMAQKRDVLVQKTKLIEGVAKALKKEGYLENVKSEGRDIIVTLKFHKKMPLLTDIKLVSKPGLRIYMGIDELKKKKGISTFILSTEKGILSMKDAIKKNTGGEAIAEVW